MDEELTSWLVGGLKGTTGHDLGALDIQRERELGVCLRVMLVDVHIALQAFLGTRDCANTR